MNKNKLIELFKKSKDKYGDAKMMGLTYQTIQNIIDGADLRVSTLEKIAAYYQVPVGYFFDEVESDGQLVKNAEIERLRIQVEAYKDALKLLGQEIRLT